MKQVINLVLILLLPFIFNSGNVKMQSQIVLYAPNIISPAHKSSSMAPPEQFIWSKVENADNYDIQITTDVTFQTINNTIDLDIQNYSDTIYSPPQNYLDADTMYFWRVKAKSNTGAESDWTDIHKFTTGVSGIHEINSNNITISPIPITNDAVISFDLNELHVVKDIKQMQVMVFDNRGTMRDALSVENSISENKIAFNTNNYTAGNYHLVFVYKGNVFATKTVIVAND